jgi:alkylated DNA repair dioxygenase AlkB
VLIPRKQCWIADEGITYSYSNKPLQRFSWSKELLELRARIEGFCSHKFNSVLANLYRDGNDSMGWHADDEVELGRNPTIASISLGAERALKVRDNKTKEIIKIDQKHGSLLIMQKGMQSTTQHSISKTKLDIGARINLTFRNIITPSKRSKNE